MRQKREHPQQWRHNPGPCVTVTSGVRQQRSRAEKCGRPSKTHSFIDCKVLEAIDARGHAKQLIFMIACPTRQLKTYRSFSKPIINTIFHNSGSLCGSRLSKPARASLYELLGVDSSASSADIRSAYRRLATLYHPDVNPSVAAHERFQVGLGLASIQAGCGSSTMLPPVHWW